MKPRIEKRAVPVALGPTQDQTESGDFHPASREIKQVRRNMACRDQARRGAGRFDTHRSGQVR